MKSSAQTGLLQRLAFNFSSDEPTPMPVC